jgi:hypothetical protein
MSDLRIPENVVTAAREASVGSDGESPLLSGRQAEGVVQAALAEWGATVEWERPAKAPACPSRIVLPWTPVDGGQ